MPDIGGVEVLRQLRSRPETKDLPVLVYTSKSLNEPERAQLESWRVRIVRKEDVSARLSAQPFLDWLSAVGVAPVGAVSDSHG
jgi:CheY-like chemotaxis protein